MYRGHFYPKNIKNPRLLVSSGCELRQRSHKHVRRKSELMIIDNPSQTHSQNHSLNHSMRIPSPKSNISNFFTQKIEYQSNPILMVKGYQKFSSPIEPYLKTYTNFIRTSSAKKSDRNKSKRTIYSQKDFNEENILTDCGEEVLNRPMTSNNVKNKYRRYFAR